MPEFISRELPGSVVDMVQKVRETYQVEWEAIVADVSQLLLENAAYYRKVLSGKEPVETAPDSGEEPYINQEED